MRNLKKVFYFFQSRRFYPAFYDKKPGSQLPGLLPYNPGIFDSSRELNSLKTGRKKK